MSLYTGWKYNGVICIKKLVYIQLTAVPLKPQIIYLIDYSNMTTMELERNFGDLGVLNQIEGVNKVNKTRK